MNSAVSAEGPECIILVEGWEKLQAVKMIRGKLFAVIFLIIQSVRMTSFLVPTCVKNKLRR